MEAYKDAKASERRYRLVYLHMNGCVYCRKFDPVWKEFKNLYASQLRNEKGVHLASFEAGDREALKFNVTGYPTVLLVRGKNEVVKVFKGERTVANLKKFVDTSVTASAVSA